MLKDNVIIPRKIKLGKLYEDDVDDIIEHLKWLSYNCGYCSDYRIFVHKDLQTWRLSSIDRICEYTMYVYNEKMLKNTEVRLFLLEYLL